MKREPAESPSAGSRPARTHLWLGAGVAALALLLIAALTVVLWKPAPPGQLIMTAGPEDGVYYEYGKRYRDILARSGVEVVLQTSSGSVENLERLRRSRDGVMVGFVPTGLAAEGETGTLVSVGAVAYEGLWVFHRAGLRLDKLSDFKGLKVAAGSPGSATRKMASQLLAINGIDPSSPALIDLDGNAAAEALQQGAVDVAILMTTSEDQAVQRLIRAPDIRLLNVRRADAYVKRFPALVRVEIPEGAADLERNLPASPVTLLAVRSNLVATDSIHPVLVDLLLDAAHEIHGGSGLIRNNGEFPAGGDSDFPLSPEAERYFKAGPSMLSSFLPYWTVVWVHRLIFFGLPVFVVLIPLLRFSPLIYRWSVRRRIYRWYGELSFIQRAIETGSGDQRQHLQRLHEIERKINGLQVPLAFAGEAYQLRAHVNIVRDSAVAAVHQGDIPGTA